LCNPYNFYETPGIIITSIEMTESRPNASQSESLKNFIVKDISCDLSYARQLAQVHYAAFRDNTLNNTMYPMHNKDALIAWSEEHQRRVMLKGDQTIIALIDPSARPEGEEGGDENQDKVIAWSRWIIPGRTRSTQRVDGSKSTKEADGDGNNKDHETHITESQPQTKQKSFSSSSILSQPELAPSAATITPASEAEELGRKYNFPPFPEGTNLALVTEFRDLLNHYRKTLFEDLKDKEAVWCKFREIEPFEPQMHPHLSTYKTNHRNIVVGSLVTHPSYQGLGCASTLLNWGIQQADAINAKIYLESTPAALKVYLKHGWQVVETAYFDLKKYGGPEEMYPLRALVREPNKSAVSSTV
jgi:GNAT superfamily N-acetyltransferase